MLPGIIKKLLRKRFENLYDSMNRKVILSLLERDPKCNLLDLGCRDGNFTIQVAKLIGTNNIHGVEVEERVAKEAMRLGIKVHIADLNLPLSFLDDESFDVILSNQVLEHIHNTDNFAQEIYRCLKPGGYAIVSTPNLAAWHNIVCLLLGYQPFSTAVSDKAHFGNPLIPYEPSGPWLRSVRVFTYSGIKEFFEYYGFKVERIMGVGYYPFSHLSRFFCWIDKRHAAYLTVKLRKRETIAQRAGS